MAFTPKTWENSPSTDTPLSASALIDMEERVTDYTDSVGAGGVELGSAAITSDATRASATYADISGLSVNVDVGTRPVVVTFSCAAANNNSATGGVSVAIRQDGTMVASAGHFLAANASSSLSRYVRLTPTAGTHTFNCQLKTVFGGTATINADSGTAYGPARISVVEV